MQEAMLTQTILKSSVAFVGQVLQMTHAGHAWVEVSEAPDIIGAEEQTRVAIDSLGDKAAAYRIVATNTVVATRIVKTERLTKECEEELIDIGVM